MARKTYFGSSGAVPIARMDMRAATEPGRALRDMFMSLGKTAADSLEKFRENNRRAEEEEETRSAISGFFLKVTLNSQKNILMLITIKR